MISSRFLEVISVTAIAAATSAGVMTEADMSGLVVPLISGGIAAIVGYFSARMTMEREMGIITEREANHFTEVMSRLGRIERKLDRKQDDA